MRSLKFADRNPYLATEPDDQLPISSNIDNKALHEASLAANIFTNNILTQRVGVLVGLCGSRSSGYRLRHVVGRLSSPCMRAALTASHSSYNEINQTHACSNAYTQNNILKGEVRLFIRCLIGF